MGCGATQGSLSANLGDNALGTFLTRSFTVGPRLGTTGQKPSFSQGTSRAGASGWWGVWNKQARQDYSAFAPVHLNVCNILMADGSVRSFVDEDRSGDLDNGLASVATPDETLEVALELPDEEVFSGAALRGL